MASSREQRTGRRPWRTTASPARGMASQRYVMARTDSRITSGVAPVPSPPPPARRTSARAAASVGKYPPASSAQNDSASQSSMSAATTATGDGGGRGGRGRRWVRSRARPAKGAGARGREGGARRRGRGSGGGGRGGGCGGRGGERVWLGHFFRVGPRGGWAGGLLVPSFFLFQLCRVPPGPALDKAHFAECPPWHSAIFF